jgi:hypothetical protein
MIESLDNNTTSKEEEKMKQRVNKGRRKDLFISVMICGLLDYIYLVKKRILSLKNHEKTAG